jgi:hypothetical protein
MADDDNDDNAADLYAAADTLAGEKAPRHRRGRKPKKKKRAADPGWRPANRAQGGGHPGFVPTRQERVFVAAMVGTRMSHEEIAAVIGNGRGRGPIATTTLQRAFRHELAGGRAHLRALTSRSIYSALRDRAPWAIQLCARNLFGWDRPRHGFSVDLPGENNELKTLQVEFISPTRRRDIEAEMNDAAPAPSADARPNYELKAIEPPKEQPFRWPPPTPGPKDWMR